MKHLLLLFLSANLFSGLNAQPILTFGNTGTVPGDAFVLRACEWQDPGAGGAVQIWDLTTLTTDSMIDLVFVDPSTTPDGIYFPTATIASLDTLGNAYNQFDINGGSLLGVSLPGSQPIVYSDPMIWVTFPCTYMTSWTDPFQAAYDLGGFNFQRTGTITATADGYGTLMMPYGQLDDVLRVTYVEDYQDVSLLTLTAHREYTYFMQAGTHYPVVNLFSYSATVLGNTQTITGAQWLEVPSTSIARNAGRTSGFSVWPVPANDAVTVRFNSGTGACTIDIIDALGQIAVHRDVITPATGMHEERIAIAGLDPALYTLRIRQGGRETAQRIVVQ
jgi:hypothetical protein